MRILIVEDEALIAMMAEDMIDAIGGTIVGVCGTVANAIDKVNAGGFDAAMLDVNLGGSSSMPVADLLREKGLPFLFTTGGTDGIDDAHTNAPILPKPYTMSDLEQALAKLV